MFTPYQLRTRIWHFFHGYHWRGAAIHSPMMYGFVREVVMAGPKRSLIRRIMDHYPTRQVLVVDCVEDIRPGFSVVVLREPFLDREQHLAWERWYQQNHCVAAHLQGCIVIFTDQRLQKQYYIIRS